VSEDYVPANLHTLASIEEMESSAVFPPS